MSEPIVLTVQRKKVTNTVDGGSSLSFVASSDMKVQSAKIFLIPEEINLEMTIKVKDE